MARNEEADVIFSFWRWEYLRRNKEYIELYQKFVSLLREVGANKIPYHILGETKTKELVKIDVEAWIEELPNDPTIKFAILALLQVFLEKFNIQIPVPPNVGPDLKTMLSAHIQAHVNNEAIEYHNLVSGFVSHNFFTFSIQDPVEAESYDLLPEGRHTLQRNSQFMEQFTKDYPGTKVNSPERLEPRIIKRGNRFFADGTPEPMMIKDKKLRIAQEQLEKNGSARRLTEAIRNRNREALRLKERRTKTDNLLRAVGLYLWSQKQESGVLSKAVIDDFYEDFPDLPENKFQLDQGEELRKLVRQTNRCIKAGDVLPMK